MGRVAGARSRPRDRLDGSRRKPRALARAAGVGRLIFPWALSSDVPPFVLWFSIASVACEPPTEVLVVLEAEPRSLARADKVRVAVRDATGRTKLDRRLRLGVEVALPTTVAIAPVDGDAARTFELEAELLDPADVVFSRQLLASSFVPNESVVMHVLFDDLCLAQTSCVAPLTCRRGTCVDGHRDPAMPDPLPPPPVCMGRACWENPWPWGGMLHDVCIYREDDLVIGATGGILVREDSVWRSEGPPDIPTILGVECWDDGRAIGFSSGRGERILWERSQDGTWRSIDHATDVEITDVWGLSADDVWFTGENGTLLHRVGSAAPVVVPLGVTGSLSAVSGTADRVLVAGDGVLRTVDSASPLEGPPGATGNYADVLAAGERYAVIADAPEGPLFAVFEGTRWSMLDPNESVTVAALDESGAAVAATSGGALYVRADSTVEFSDAGSSDATTVRGAALEDGRGYIVGSRGLFFRLAGDRFVDARSFVTNIDLSAVSASYPEGERVVAVGAEGLVLERDASGAWTPRVVAAEGAPSPPPGFHDVWVGRTLAVAVGAGGLVAESDPSWTVVNVPGVTADLRAVAGLGDRVVAVGGSAAIERGPEGWTSVALPAGFDATAVAFHAGALHVGGADGRLVREDGPGFTELERAAGPITRLRSSEGALYVLAGDVYRSSGTNELVAMLGAPALDVIVGADGPQWILTDVWLYEAAAGGYEVAGDGGTGLALTASGVVVAGEEGRIYRVVPP